MYTERVSVQWFTWSRIYIFLPLVIMERLNDANQNQEVTPRIEYGRNGIRYSAQPNPMINTRPHKCVKDSKPFCKWQPNIASRESGDRAPGLCA